MSIKVIEKEKGTKIYHLGSGSTFKLQGTHYLYTGSGQAVNLESGEIRTFKKSERVEVTDFLLVEPGSFSESFSSSNKETEAEDDDIKDDNENNSDGLAESNDDAKKKKSKTLKPSSRYKDMLLAFFKKTCRLGRFPKTGEINEDKNMLSWSAYYNVLGSKSNIKDMIFTKLKKDKIEKEYLKAASLFCNKCEKETRICNKEPVNCLFDHLRKK